MGTERKLDSIQILRALAAFMVLCYHSWLSVKAWPSAGGAEGAGGGFFDFGYTGVNLFFVISGFVFWRMMTVRSFDLREFAVNRFRRIYPNYWIFTSLVVAAYLVNPNWNLGDNPYTASSIISSYLILPQQIAPILVVGWSLEQEMVFYLLYAALNHLRAARALLPLLLALGTLGLFKAALRAPGGAWDFWDYRILSEYFLQFALGAWIFKHQDLLASRGWKFPLALTVVFGWLSFYGMKLVELGNLHVIAWTLGLCATYGSLVVAALAAERVGHLQSAVSRFAVQVGEASYSLYLCHWLVVSALGKVAAAFGLPRWSWLAGPYQWFSIAAAIAFSLLYYAGVERRLVRARARPSLSSL